jgi:Ca2+/Na+ antiporter
VDEYWKLDEVMFFADMIFPVFTTPYLLVVFFPWAAALALISEMIVFWRFYPDMRRWRLIAGVLGANAFSWFVGIGIASYLLPNGSWYDPMTRAHVYIQPYPVLSFVVALLLSIILEYAVWRLISRKKPMPLLGKANAIANVVSYAVLIGCWIGFSFFFH